jgi:hypothetical protein
MIHRRSSPAAQSAIRGHYAAGLNGFTPKRATLSLNKEAIFIDSGAGRFYYNETIGAVTAYISRAGRSNRVVISVRASPSYGCPSEQENVMPMGVVIIAIVAVSFGTMSTVLKIWLSRPGRSAIPQPEVKEIRDGLRHLQDAVDAIAIEVERLSEGQRFTTKLLADQAKKTAELIRTE